MITYDQIYQTNIPDFKLVKHFKNAQVNYYSSINDSEEILVDSCEFAANIESENEDTLSQTQRIELYDNMSMYISSDRVFIHGGDYNTFYSSNNHDSDEYYTFLNNIKFPRATYQNIINMPNYQEFNDYMTSANEVIFYASGINTIILWYLISLYPNSGNKFVFLDYNLGNWVLDTNITLDTLNTLNNNVFFIQNKNKLVPQEVISSAETKVLRNIAPESIYTTDGSYFYDYIVYYYKNNPQIGTASNVDMMSNQAGRTNNCSILNINIFITTTYNESYNLNGLTNVTDDNGVKLNMFMTNKIINISTDEDRNVSFTVYPLNSFGSTRNGSVLFNIGLEWFKVSSTYTHTGSTSANYPYGRSNYFMVGYGTNNRAGKLTNGSTVTGYTYDDYSSITMTNFEDRGIYYNSKKCTVMNDAHTLYTSML